MIKITDKKIVIVSGEGEIGGVFSSILRTVELYVGKKTERAVKSRLTRERCNGDRWARAIQYAYTNDYGEFGFNVETDECCIFPECD